MADPDKTQQEILNALQEERNRARGPRAESGISPSFADIGRPVGDLSNRMGSSLKDRSNALKTKSADRADDAQRRRDAGEAISPTEKLALNARERARRVRIKALERALSRRKPQPGDRGNPDYPNPVSFLGFFAFFCVAALADLLPLAADIIGLGFLANWIVLPIVWMAYIAIIVRRAPRSLIKKFLGRAAIASLASAIPIIGELLPEWIATALGSYIMIQHYLKGKSSLGVPVPEQPGAKQAGGGSRGRARAAA